MDLVTSQPQHRVRKHTSCTLIQTQLSHSAVCWAQSSAYCLPMTVSPSAPWAPQLSSIIVLISNDGENTYKLKVDYLMESLLLTSGSLLLGTSPQSIKTPCLSLNPAPSCCEPALLKTEPVMLYPRQQAWSPPQREICTAKLSQAKYPTWEIIFHQSAAWKHIIAVVKSKKKIKTPLIAAHILHSWQHK